MTEFKESKLSEFTQQKFSLAVDMAGEYMIKLAIIEFPFLGLPVIKQIFSVILKRIISKAKDEGQLAISFAFIDSETHAQKEEYEKAMQNLSHVLSSNPTEEQKNEAINEAKKRMADLIRFPAK